MKDKDTSYAVIGEKRVFLTHDKAIEEAKRKAAMTGETMCVLEIIGTASPSVVYEEAEY